MLWGAIVWSRCRVKVKGRMTFGAHRWRGKCWSSIVISDESMLIW